MVRPTRTDGNAVMKAFSLSMHSRRGIGGDK